MAGKSPVNGGFHRKFTFKYYKWSIFQQAIDGWETLSVAPNGFPLFIGNIYLGIRVPLAPESSLLTMENDETLRQNLGNLHGNLQSWLVHGRTYWIVGIPNTCAQPSILISLNFMKLSQGKSDQRFPATKLFQRLGFATFAEQLWLRFQNFWVLTTELTKSKICALNINDFSTGMITIDASETDIGG